MYVGKIPPPEKVAELISKTIDVLKAEPNVVKITTTGTEYVYVVGAIYGQFYDLIEIFRIHGYPDGHNIYVFNGAFVNQGKSSLEVMITLMSLKCAFPYNVFLVRGGQENYMETVHYGFATELCRKNYGSTFSEFLALFAHLPLCSIINGRYFVVHGGPPLGTMTSPKTVSLATINNLNRKYRDITLHLIHLYNMVWSDPQEAEGKSFNSRRKADNFFGPNLTKEFLAENQLEYLIRSLGEKEDGYHVEHDGKCITVFSAPNYMWKGYKGAVVVLSPHNSKPSLKSFNPADCQEPTHALQLKDLDKYLKF